ncbi:MAG TPA: hypothetical protein VNE83_00145 [Terriglobales bacterium]|nr:hypothetical protein [Terriglobales bacterium]
MPLCGIEGSFTVAAPLGPHFASARITPLSYSFSNGEETFTSSTSDIGNFTVATDASGNISQWNIFLNFNSAAYYLTTRNDLDYAADSYNGYAILHNDPGTWSNTAKSGEPLCGAYTGNTALAPGHESIDDLKGPLWLCSFRFSFPI